MKKKIGLSRLAVVVVALGLNSIAAADSVVEVWPCEVSDATSFLFVDSYPDLAAWEKTKTYLRNNDETEEMFSDVSECSENSLHCVEPTE